MIHLDGLVLGVLSKFYDDKEIAITEITQNKDAMRYTEPSFHFNNEIMEIAKRG